MFNKPGIVQLDESLRTNLLNAASRSDGCLILIAASVRMLSTAHLALAEVIKTLQVEHPNLIQITDDPSHSPNIDVLPSGGLTVFRELRDQDSPQHSAVLAGKYVEKGVSVLAVVHGTDTHSVIENITKLGFPISLAMTKVVIVGFLLENLPHYRETE